MMKRIAALLAGAALAIGMAATLANAMPFTVFGSENPGAYIAFSDAYIDATTSSPIVYTPVAVTVPAYPAWVNGNWMTLNNPDQSWPMGLNSGSLPGTYAYLTEFNLTGFDPLSAIIKGSWASDNIGKLYLNDFPNELISTNTGFGSLTSFTINSGFVSGQNVLAFIVENDSYVGSENNFDPSGINPTGLLVNIDSATANPVPEPGTMVLLGAGILAFAIFGKRRRNNKVI